MAPTQTWRHVALAVTIMELALTTIDEFLSNAGTRDGLPGAAIALSEGSHAAHKALVMLAEVQAQIQTQTTTTDLLLRPSRSTSEASLSMNRLRHAVN
jgi:phosphoribosylcarboxyaminoimidazole (NCAIR) mutase